MTTTGGRTVKLSVQPDAIAQLLVATSDVRTAEIGDVTRMAVTDSKYIKYM
jgi:hypothetical protein